MRLPWAVLGSVAASELGFYAWYRQRVATINESEPNIEAALTHDERATTFSRCLAHPPEPRGAHGVRRFVEGWFMETSFDQLSRQDIDKWLGWGLFGQRLSEMNPADQRQLRQLVAQVEKSTCTQFVDAPTEQQMSTGRKPSWEPLPVHHKPLLFYGVVYTADLLTGLWLRYQGFEHRQTSCKQLEYWVHEGPKQATTPAAVFFHGMGVGLLPYCTSFVPALTALQARGTVSRVILVRSPHVAMDLVNSDGTPLAIDKLLQASHEIIGQGRKAVLFGHSYGTFQVAQICRHRPDLSCGVVVLDPMCFLLHLKDTTDSFCYAHLRPNEAIIPWLIRTELLMNVCMRRNFNWYHNILWLEDLKSAGLLGTKVGSGIESRTFVVVADQDDKMPAAEVLGYLQQSKGNAAPKIIVLEGCGHGDVLADSNIDVIFSQIEPWIQDISRGLPEDC